jgi:Leucine-rich repeat (LRR) protein
MHVNDWLIILQGDLGILIQEFLSSIPGSKGYLLFSTCKALYNSPARQLFIQKKTLVYRGTATPQLPCRSIFTAFQFLEDLSNCQYYHPNVRKLAVVGRIGFLDYFPPVTLDLVQASLKSFSALHVLNLKDCDIVRIDALSLIPTLTVLQLRDCEIKDINGKVETIRELSLTDSHLCCFDIFPNLEKLTLRGWSEGRSSISLRGLPYLTYLWIEGSYFVAGTFSLPRLEQFLCFLGNIQFEQQDCLLGCQKLSLFKLVAMFPDSQDSDQILTLLPHFHQLESIHIGLHEMFKFDLSILGRYPHLKKATFSGKFANISPFLEVNSQITTLELYLDIQLLRIDSGIFCSSLKSLKVNKIMNSNLEFASVHEQLETLVVVNSRIVSLHGIEKLYHLQVLFLDMEGPIDLTALEHRLFRKLGVHGAQLDHIDPLVTLKNLQYLDLSSCTIFNWQGLLQLPPWIRVRFKDTVFHDKTIEQLNSNHYLRLGDILRYL